jgi:hypothetical protein
LRYCWERLECLIIFTTVAWVSVRQGSQGEEHSNKAVTLHYFQLLCQLTYILPKAVGSLHQVICVQYGIAPCGRIIMQTSITTADGSLEYFSVAIPPNHYTVLVYSNWLKMAMGLHKDITSDNLKSTCRFLEMMSWPCLLLVQMVYHMLESGADGGNKYNKTAGHYWSLPGLSINIHTGYNDSLLRHAVFFGKGSNNNALNYVIVCQWLSEMKHYPIGTEDRPGVHFGMVDPETFKTLDNHAHARA